MKILFVHEVSYREKFIFEMHEFPELLAIGGHEVSFLEFAEEHESWIPKLRSQVRVIEGRVYNSALVRLYTPARFGKGIVARLFAVLATPFAARRAILSEKPDVIVLYSVPTSGWQTLVQAHSRHIPVVFRALDVSHQIRPTVFAGLVRMAEKFIYKRVEILSANNPAMARYCIEISGRTLPSVVNLPPLHVRDFIGESSREPLRQFGIPEDSEIIMYMGSFFRFSGLDDCIARFRIHSERNPKLRLVLVGGGELEHTLRSMVEAFGLRDKVIFTGVVAYAKLGEVLRAADVAINPFRAELLTNVALPHKVFQYMASGVPVVSTNLEGIRGVLGDDSGVLWETSPEAVIDSAVSVVSQPISSRKLASDRQRARLGELFDPQLIIHEWEKTLVSALKVSE